MYFCTGIGDVPYYYHKAISKFKKQKNARFEAKNRPGNKSVAIRFEEINALKRQLIPEKTTSNKKRNWKAESLLFTEISLITIFDEGEQQEYFINFYKSLSTSKNKLAKTSHPTTNR
jgi:hypothetical protein